MTNFYKYGLDGWVFNRHQEFFAAHKWLITGLLPEIYLHRRCLRALCLTVLFLSSLSWQAPGLARGLELDEQRQAAILAASIPWQARRSVASSETGLDPFSTPSSMSSSADTAGQTAALDHPLGVQTLFIEKADTKTASASRVARVYQYDYTRRSSRLLELDLSSNSLIRSWPIDSVHLPLNEMEIDFARQLLAADAGMMDELRTQQAKRGDLPFQSLDELDVKASIFEPIDAGHPCTRTRCALLSLFDKTRTVFSTEPVIYLDTQRVGLLHKQ